MTKVHENKYSFSIEANGNLNIELHLNVTLSSDLAKLVIMDASAIMQRQKRLPGQTIDIPQLITALSPNQIEDFMAMSLAT